MGMNAFTGRIPPRRAVNQQVEGAGAGFKRVFVRRCPIGADEIELIHDRPREVAVQVVAGADEGGGSGEITDGADEVGFGVVDAFDRHRAVHVEIDTIPGSARAQVRR